MTTLMGVHDELDLISGPAGAKDDDDDLEVSPVSRPLPPPPRPRRNGTSQPGRSGTRATPPPPPPRKPPPKTRAGGRRDDDDDDLPPPRRKSGGGIWTILGIVGGIFLVLGLIACTGVGLVFYGVFSFGQKVVQEQDDFAKDHGLKPAETFEEAVEAVGAGNSSGRRQGGLQFIQNMPVDPAKKKEIIAAVKPCLDDGDNGVRDAAAKAFCRHAGPEDAGLLMLMLKDNSQTFKEQALEALVRQRDQRVIPILAEKLGHIFEGSKAEKGLRDFGPVAEKEVLKYAFDADHGKRNAAQKLLRDYGVKDDTLFSQAVQEVARDPKKRVGALEWLAQQPVEELRRTEIAKLVGPFVKDSDHGVSTNAMKVFERYASKDQVPLIIDIVKDTNIHQSERRNQAIAMLGRFKDPRAAPILADLLDDAFFEQAAKNALEVMGPVAESDVLPLMHHPRDDVRTRARSLLRSYGTKDSVLIDRTIEDLSSPDNQTRRSALDWLTQRKAGDETRRADVSKALEVVLKDNDRQLVEQAIKALELWATRDNIPTLLKVAADPTMFGAREKAIDALAKIKDEQRVPALILMLALDDNKLVVKARDYLQEMGPAVEKPLTEYGIKSPNAKIRINCWHVLTFVAGKDNIKELKMLASKEVQPVKQVADTACKTIESR